MFLASLIVHVFSAVRGLILDVAVFLNIVISRGALELIRNNLICTVFVIEACLSLNIQFAVNFTLIMVHASSFLRISRSSLANHASSVQHLQKELQQCRDRHEQELAALQDSHAVQISKLKAAQVSLDASNTSTENDKLCGRLAEVSLEDDEDGTCSARPQHLQQQLQFQKEQLQQWKERESDWREEKRELASELQEVKAEVEKRTRLTSGANEEINKLKEENQRHIASLEELDAQNQLVVDELVKHKSSLQDEVEKLRVSQKELQENLDEQAEESTHSEASKVVLEEAKLQLTELREEENKLQSSIEAEREKVVQLQGELRQAQEECTCAKQELQQKGDGEAKAQIESSALRQENCLLEERLADVKKSRMEQETNINQLFSSHGRELQTGSDVTANLRTILSDLADTRWQRDTLEKRIAEQSAKSQGLEDELDEIKSDKDDLQNESSELKERVQSLLQDLGQLREVRRLDTIPEEGEETLSGASSGRVDALEAEVNALREARGNLETEASRLRSEKEELLQGLHANEGRLGNYSNLEVEVAALRSDKVNLEKIIEEYHQETATDAQQQERITSLETQINDHISEINSLKKNQHDLEAQMLQQTDAVQQKHSQMEQLKMDMQDLESSKTNLEGQLQASAENDSAQVCRLKANLAGLEEKLMLLVAAKTMFEHERNCYEIDLQQMEKEKRLALNSVEDSKKHIAQLKKEVATYSGSETEAIKALQKDKEDLHMEMNKVKTELIYKEDRLDHYLDILGQVGKIFDVEHDGENNVINYKELEGKLIEKSELLRSSVKKSLDLQKEVEIFKNQAAMIEAESVGKIAEAERKTLELEESLQKTQTSLQDSTAEKDMLTMELSTATSYKDSAEKVEPLILEVDALKREKDEILIVLSEKTERCGGLQHENERLVEAKEAHLRLQEEMLNALTSKEQESAELAGMNKEAVDNLSRMVNTKEQEIETLYTKLGAREEELSKLIDGEDKKDKRLLELQELYTDLETKLTNQAESDSNMASIQLTQKTAWEQEKKALQDRISELEVTVKEKESSLAVTKEEENHRLEEQQTTIVEIQNMLIEERKKTIEVTQHQEEQLKSLTADREQIIAALNQKHQESLSYHAEIQRLSQLLTEETSKVSSLQQTTADSNKQLLQQLAQAQEKLSELEKMKQNTLTESSELCGNLKSKISELEADGERLQQERDQLRMANSQFNNQYSQLSKEHGQLKEKESRLSTECERLREHLVGVEEHYTREALRAEEREATLRATLAKMEEKISVHSNMYNSVSQRAVETVEGLKEEVNRLTEQREEAVTRLHHTEETAEQNQSALDNLQAVLADFQRGQSRTISEAVEKERQQLREEKQKVATLEDQMTNLKSQLSQAQEGLAAASRLGEELQRRELSIARLKSQVSAAEEVTQKSRDELVKLNAHSESSVDKQLVRNLMLGYFATPSDKRQEVLHVLSTVLAFSPEERVRTGLDSQAGPSGWLSSISNFLAPPPSNLHVTSRVLKTEHDQKQQQQQQHLDHTSLSQAFVRFLQSESSPRPAAKLPAVQMAEETEKKQQHKVNPFVSAMVPPVAADGVGSTQPAQVVVSSSSTRTSSPLLAAASSCPPTLPTVTAAPPSTVSSSARILNSLLTESSSSSSAAGGST